MRISQRHQMEKLAGYLTAQQESINKLQTQVSTSKRIQAPEDDPSGTKKSINLNSYLSSVKNSLSVVETSQEWTDASSEALQSLYDFVTEAQTQAASALNGSLSAEDRTGIATDVEALFAQIVDVANTQYAGKYLFSGYEVDTKSYEADLTTLTATYQGDSGTIKRQIETSSQVTINTPGNAMFDSAFASLKVLRDALVANDETAIKSAGTALEASSKTVLTELAHEGSLSESFDESRSRLESLKITVESLISDVADTDVAAAAVQLTVDQNSYDATLSLISQSYTKSLFDYLG